METSLLVEPRDVRRRSIGIEFAPLVPLHRSIFYFGLLTLAAFGTQRSPLWTPELVASTRGPFLTPQGLGWLLPALFYQYGSLVSLRVVTLLAWILAILGVGGRIATLTLGIGFLLLHSIGISAAGVTHRWYLPVLSLLILGLSYRQLDGTERGWITTSEARTLVLLTAIMITFNAGLSKLINSGIAWADGTTLQFYVANYATPRAPRIAAILRSSLPLCAVVSFLTLAVEVLSPLALLWRGLTLVYLVLMAVFHLGVAMVLSPFYLPHAWCYLIIAPLTSSRKSSTNHDNQTSRRAILGIVMASAFLLAGALGTEWPPLTAVSMYSEYRGPTGAFANDGFRSESQALATAKLCYTRGACTFSPSWFHLMLIDGEGVGTPYVKALPVSHVQAKQIKRLEDFHGSQALVRPRSKSLHSWLEAIAKEVAFDPELCRSFMSVSLQVRIKGVTRPLATLGTRGCRT